MLYMYLEWDWDRFLAIGFYVVPLILVRGIGLFGLFRMGSRYSCWSHKICCLTPYPSKKVSLTCMGANPLKNGLFNAVLQNLVCTEVFHLECPMPFQACFLSDHWGYGGTIRSGMLFLNTLRPRQDGRRFPDDIFKCFFLEGNYMNFD